MPVKYDPKDAVKVLPEGTYHGVLAAVEDKTSKAGNPMQVATWTVFGPNGQKRDIRDYIVVPSCVYKLRNIARAIGEAAYAEFKSGAFQLDPLVGSLSLNLEIKVEQQDGYDDKNVIDAYKPRDPAETAPAEVPEFGSSAADEDIPF